MTSHVKCRSATADRKQSKSNGPSGLRRCILKKLKTALCRKSTIGAPGHAQHCGCGSPASKSGRDYGNTSFTYTRAAAAAVAREWDYCSQVTAKLRWLTEADTPTELRLQDMRTPK